MRGGDEFLLLRDSSMKGKDHVDSEFDTGFRTQVNYRASGFPQESSTAIASCSDAISSAVGVGESGRVGPKEEEKALEALEGLFEKSTWMGGYSVAVLN